jgi:hypothetical protein
MGEEQNYQVKEEKIPNLHLLSPNNLQSAAGLSGRGQKPPFKARLWGCIF